MTVHQIQREEPEEDQSCSDIRYAEALRDIRQHCDETLGREPPEITYTLETGSFILGASAMLIFILIVAWVEFSTGMFTAIWRTL